MDVAMAIVLRTMNSIFVMLDSIMAMIGRKVDYTYRIAGVNTLTTRFTNIFIGRLLPLLSLTPWRVETTTRGDVLMSATTGRGRLISPRTLRRLIAERRDVASDQDCSATHRVVVQLRHSTSRAQFARP
jgi:hypothetical protein